MLAEPLIHTVGHVWNAMRPLGAPMAIMGGVALAAWQHLRATTDVDILVGLDGENANLVLDALRKHDIRPDHIPPPRQFGSSRVIQLRYDPPETLLDVQLHLLMGNTEFHRQALSRRVPIQLGELDQQVEVLACEDLILLKLLAGRIVDRADAAYLLRFNWPQLDQPYLLQWTRRLEVVDSFHEVWDEAFPGEPPPGD